MKTVSAFIFHKWDRLKMPVQTLPHRISFNIMKLSAMDHPIRKLLMEIEPYWKPS